MAWGWQRKRLRLSLNGDSSRLRRTANPCLPLLTSWSHSTSDADPGLAERTGERSSWALNGKSTNPSISAGNQPRLSRRNRVALLRSFASFADNERKTDSSSFRRFARVRSPSRKFSIASARTDEKPFSPRRAASASKALRCSAFISTVVLMNLFYTCMCMRIRYLMKLTASANPPAPEHPSPGYTWLAPDISLPLLHTSRMPRCDRKNVQPARCAAQRCTLPQRNPS